VDVGAAFVADAQSPVLVQPGDRALDDPALASEPGAVRALWPRDLRLDAALAELAAALPRVVGAVAEQLAWAAAGSAAAPAHGGIASTSGSIWMMSLRLPPVSEAASGVPRAQAIR
jgi:hypothetical protein